MGKESNDLNSLRSFSKARLLISTPEGIVTTKHSLALTEALAKAKDAIHFPMDWKKISQQCPHNLSSILLESRVADRAQYLNRPDLGRLLSERSFQHLDKSVLKTNKIDICIADGLSPLGIQTYAAEILTTLASHIHPDRLGQVFFVQNGRIAIGDEIAKFTKSEIMVVLVGERPGLSSFDSVGAYLTYTPTPGHHDSKRNCISNICASGLPIEIAAQRIAFFVQQALQFKKTGIELKENDSLMHENLQKLLQAPQ